MAAMMSEARPSNPGLPVARESINPIAVATSPSRDAIPPYKIVDAVGSLRRWRKAQQAVLAAAH
jgi:hypothetical protein